MREALRGALLSVLFFGLMIGGAPTTAAADLPHSTSAAAQIKMLEGPCPNNGDVNTDQGCLPLDFVNWHNIRQLAQQL